MESVIDDLADKWEAVDSEPGPKKQPEPEPEKGPGEGAKNAAGLLMAAIEGGWRMVDDRIQYEDQAKREGAEKMAAVLEKYGLGSAVGKVPYAEEIAAGWFLGALFKQTWLTIKALWAEDRKKQKAKEQAQAGDSDEGLTDGEA
ncbi:hypothetical protein [Teredinibacter turnerae]|uniref:hypothetical protein n=1 Tax=Teredinibacter turnerae TaxID=2426 RepID=UPI0030D3D973